MSDTEELPPEEEEGMPEQQPAPLPEPEKPAVEGRVTHVAETEEEEKERLERETEPEPSGYQPPAEDEEPV